MKPIPSDLALRAAQRLARNASAGLVLPGDPRREAVLLALAAVHSLSGSGWSLDYAREHVCVTLPGVGSVAAKLLSAVPYVGPLFARAIEGLDRPTMFMSPVAVGDGPTLVGVTQHELGHVGDIRRGGLVWCAAYGIVGEVRAGAEGPCYGTDMAHRCRLGGVSPEQAEADANDALSHYGLDADGLSLARAIVRSAGETARQGGDPGGVVAESLAALAAEGWSP